jgi:hypothetical protein
MHKSNQDIHTQAKPNQFSGEEQGRSAGCCAELLDHHQTLSSRAFPLPEGVVVLALHLNLVVIAGSPQSYRRLTPSQIE